jgi:hypothetical protein
MTDVRIHCGLKSHRKTKKLRLRLGAEACWSWICLLMHVAEYRPDGALAGMSLEDIAIDADYDADPAVFVDTLLELGMLDRDSEGVLHVHGWSEWNSFALNAPARRRAAQIANHLRWKKQGRIVCDPETCDLCNDPPKSDPDPNGIRTGSEPDPTLSESDPTPEKPESPLPYLPLESTSRKTSPSEGKRQRRDYSPAFQSFWSAFPDRPGVPKGDKLKASKLFSRVVDGEADELAVLEAAQRYADSPDVAKGFRKDAERWLPNWREWLAVGTQSAPKPESTPLDPRIRALAEQRRQEAAR